MLISDNLIDITIGLSLKITGENMGIEIERKFLVKDRKWKAELSEHIIQGYLNSDKNRIVRVRIAGSRAWITIKGLTTGTSRLEFEYEIPLEDARVLISICEQPVLEKRRSIVIHRGIRWEVDEFLGENDGLVVAEVELREPDQNLELPDWIGKEVTDDPRYFNSNLLTNPFSQWNLD